MGTGDALDTDVFRVEKPTTLAAAAQALPPSTPAAPAASGIRATDTQINGVDQPALAQCLQTDPQNCLSTVPGLAACVAARTICNTTVRASTQADKPRTRSINLTEARRLVTSYLGLTPTTTRRSAAAADTAITMTAGQARTRLPDGAVPRDVSDAEAVHVVSGTGPVRAWDDSNDRTFQKWITVTSAATGALLYTRLHNGTE